MSSFKEKYDRANVELEQKGQRLSKSLLLNALNKPFDTFARMLHLRPIFYASYFEMWLRTALLYFVIVTVGSYLLLNDKSTWLEQERWVGWIVSTLIFATIMPFFYRRQAKRKDISRWEDL